MAPRGMVRARERHPVDHPPVQPVRWASGSLVLAIDPGPGLPLTLPLERPADPRGGRLAGVPLPRPSGTRRPSPEPIVRWMAECSAPGRRPTSTPFPAPQSASARPPEAPGVDLHGDPVHVSGEPRPGPDSPSSQRWREDVPRLGREAGWTSVTAASPPGNRRDPLSDDLRAVIQPEGPTAESRPASTALLFSTLRPTLPSCCSNVTSEIMPRSTGALRMPARAPGAGRRTSTPSGATRSSPREASGCSRHDLDRVPRAGAPRSLRGGPTDYQLVEDEVDDGQPRLRLVVDPAVGPLDHRAVTEAFLGALADGAGGARVMELALRQAGVLEVEHRPPIPTPSGKILHLHASGSRTMVRAGAGSAEPA